MSAFLYNIMIRRESSGAGADGTESAPLMSATIEGTKYTVDMNGFHESSVSGTGRSVVNKQAEGMMSTHNFS